MIKTCINEENTCRFHPNTSSVTPMLQQLQWPTLQERRAQAKVYMMYRIVYSLVDIPSSHLTPTLSVRGHNMKFLIPYARTFTYQRSFFPDTIRMWNSLPETVVSCLTLDSFREECNPSDSARLVLNDFNSTVNRYFSHHLMIVPAPPMHQYDDTPMMVSVLYWKKNMI